MPKLLIAVACAAVALFSVTLLGGFAVLPEDVSQVALNQVSPSELTAQAKQLPMGTQADTH